MDDVTLLVAAGAFIVIVVAVVLFARPFRGVERRDDHSNGSYGDSGAAGGGD